MENNPLIISDEERKALLYERFRDVCLVEKEVWTEIYMPRQVEKGMVLTNQHECYEVLIDDEDVEDAEDDTNAPQRPQQRRRTHVSSPNASARIRPTPW